MYVAVQTGRQIKIRFAEHQKYNKPNNPKSAYSMHIFNNRHECGNIENTMEIRKIFKSLQNKLLGNPKDTNIPTTGYNDPRTIYLNPLFTLIQGKIREKASAAHETG